MPTPPTPDPNSGLVPASTLWGKEHPAGECYIPLTAEQCERSLARAISVLSEAAARLGINARLDLDPEGV